MSDFAEFPDELVIHMQAGCSPGHPLTPTFCLGIGHKLEMVSNDAVRSARYVTCVSVKEQVDGLAATVAEYEVSIRARMVEIDDLLTICRPAAPSSTSVRTRSSSSTDLTARP